MAVDDTEINRLQVLSDDKLLAELGRDILRQEKGGLQARPPSFRSMVKTGKDWLDEKNQQIKLAVCKDARVREVAQSEGSTKEQLFKVVADVLGGLAFFVPIGTVAEILVRRGLPSYCEAMWQKDT